MGQGHCFLLPFSSHTRSFFIPLNALSNTKIVFFRAAFQNIFVTPRSSLPPSLPPSFPSSRLSDMEKRYLSQSKKKLHGVKETNPDERLKIIEDKQATVRRREGGGREEGGREELSVMNVPYCDDRLKIRQVIYIYIYIYICNGRRRNASQ